MSSDPREVQATLSQWQLIRLRFQRHKVAVFCMHFLILLYALAIFAEWIAPHHAQWKDLRYIYAPPQIPKFSLAHGWHVHPVERQIDPVSLRSYYIERRDLVTPLGFLVRGEETRLWGLIPLRHRLFGVATHRIAPDADPALVRSWFFLGADKYGRDIYSRMIFGSRVSLSIGLISIVVVFLLGSAIGGISGYLGGAVDNVIQRLIEIIKAFPELPLWLALAAVLPSDWPPLKVYFAITIMLSLINWTGLARVVRGKMLALREEDYAMAARLLGASHARVIFRHLLPGFTSHIIVALTMAIPGMILGETALSFLGLGLRPPVVSWGVMLQDSMNIQVVATYPWLLMPVFFIILTVLAFNFFGDGLRDAADPYGSK
ncbi:MAG TPA: ABC transporter permease [Kiritimatiellia bacterium]|nr:ABC transporter permease [Kiritimatiellia bacterium]